MQHSGVLSQAACFRVLSALKCLIPKLASSSTALSRAIGETSSNADNSAKSSGVKNARLGVDESVHTASPHGRVHHVSDDDIESATPAVVSNKKPQRSRPTSSLLSRGSGGQSWTPGQVPVRGPGSPLHAPLSPLRCAVSPKLRAAEAVRCLSAECPAAAGSRPGCRHPMENNNVKRGLWNRDENSPKFVR